jgi:integrase
LILKRVLSIDKTLYYKNQNDYRFTEPKTKTSIRHNVLDKTTLLLLKAWKNAQQKVFKTGYIMSYNGISTQKYSIAHAIKRYTKKAGVHRIRIHALRHSHAYLLISMGENPLIIWT